MKLVKTLSAALLSLALTAALLAGCAGNAPAASASAATSTASSASVGTAEAAAIHVVFNITDKDGSTASVTLDATAGETLADALLSAGVISQEEHDAGFVTVVNGIATDYDADQSWWALVDANGEMTATGIADITLADGDSYGFVYTVG